VTRAADVLDIGMATRETRYFRFSYSVSRGELACTASHNPKTHTGAKLVKRGVITLPGDPRMGSFSIDQVRLPTPSRCCGSALEPPSPASTWRNSGTRSSH